MCSVVLRILFKIWRWGPIVEVFGILISTSKFWKIWSRLLLRIPTNFGKIWILDFGDIPKLHWITAAEFSFFCQNLLHLATLENLESLTPAQIQIWIFDPKIKFWILANLGSFFNLVLPNLDRSRRQLSNDTKIVKFGQILVDQIQNSYIKIFVGFRLGSQSSVHHMNHLFRTGPIAPMTPTNQTASTATARAKPKTLKPSSGRHRLSPTTRTLTSATQPWLPIISPQS